MVGHLNLQDMNENFEMKCKNQERFLDSPDSGLPLSPSPPFFALSPRIPEDKGNPISLRNSPAPATRSQEGKLIPYISLNSLPLDPRHRMQPVCFGERIELNCESAQEIRCHSLVRYDSEKHYRDCIYYETVPTITFYTETIITTPNCTWRNYKSQLRFEPRQKPLRFESTTIIFPKRTKNIFRTTLNYNPRGSSRRYMSSVRLQTIEMVKPCFIYMENL